MIGDFQIKPLRNRSRIDEITPIGINRPRKAKTLRNHKILGFTGYWQKIGKTAFIGTNKTGNRLKNDFPMIHSEVKIKQLDSNSLIIKE